MPLSSRPRFVLSPDRAKYSGRSSALTRSSIFSVTLMANPPSCGQMRPTMKAPKMAWMPMMLVKKELVSTSRMVSAMMLSDGPLCSAPVRRSTQWKPGRTSRNRKSV